MPKIPGLNIEYVFFGTILYLEMLNVKYLI